MPRRNLICRTRGLSASVLLVSFTYACGAQVDSSYRGEPLATLTGHVVSSAPFPAVPFDAALVWRSQQYYTANGGPACCVDRFVKSDVRVDGIFPAGFDLTLYEPPPAGGETLRNEGVSEDGLLKRHSGAWIGAVVAIAAGANADDVMPKDILGVDREHTVLYFDHDAKAPADAPSASDEPPDEVANLASLLHVPPTKGYHLALVDRGAQGAEGAFRACESGGLCVRVVGVENAVQQSFFDWSFAKCTEGSQVSCTRYQDPRTPDERTENDRCNGLVAARGAKDEAELEEERATGVASSPCQVPWREVPNPEGFASPITIVLGTSIWDAQ